MKKFVLLLAGLLFAVPPLMAQPAGGPVPGMDLSLVRLFGKDLAFSAKATTKTTDATGKSMEIAMSFAKADQKMRVEVDLTQIKGDAVPAAMLASLGQMGMAKVISITALDTQVSYVIYPGIQAYAKSPLPDAQLNALASDLKMKKTELGKETLDGHPCVKNKVAFTAEDGTAHEAIVWNASDLKDFPLQIQTQEGKTSMSLRYSDVQLKAPAASQFEPPAGYTAYPSMQELMMAAMKKMMGSTPPVDAPALIK